ncbi:MAG: monofunctional biosynthetic peptidoglycan transglycosylase [Methylomicrobium sp.]
MVLALFVAGSLLSVAALRYLPVPISAFMLHRHIEHYLQHRNFKHLDYRWVDRKQISRYAFSAVIASEDQRFFEHNGFDFDSIRKAVDARLSGGKLRGASTISQQVAKNLFLSPSKSFWRKGIEAWFTVLIECLWPKDRIVEVYLNIAEFGDHLFGIEAASKRYFGISSKHLDPKQAALLAATLPNPHRFKANAPTPYLYKRRAWILKQMHNLNYRYRQSH